MVEVVSLILKCIYIYIYMYMNGLATFCFWFVFFASVVVVANNTLL